LKKRHLKEVVTKQYLRIMYNRYKKFKKYNYLKNISQNKNKKCMETNGKIVKKSLIYAMIKHLVN